MEEGSLGMVTQTFEIGSSPLISNSVWIQAARSPSVEYAFLSPGSDAAGATLAMSISGVIEQLKFSQKSYLSELQSII